MFVRLKYKWLLCDLFNLWQSMNIWSRVDEASKINFGDKNILFAFCFVSVIMNSLFSSFFLVRPQPEKNQMYFYHKNKILFHCHFYYYKVKIRFSDKWKHSFLSWKFVHYQHPRAISLFYCLVWHSLLKLAHISRKMFPLLERLVRFNFQLVS